MLKDQAPTLKILANAVRQEKNKKHTDWKGRDKTNPPRG